MMTTRSHFVPFASLVALMGATLLPVTAARADLGFWTKALIGTWRHPAYGDVYRFNSDATYTFTAGPGKSRTGHFSHSGYWKTAQPTERESGGSMEGPVALVVKSRSRVVSRNGHRGVLSTTRLHRLVVDVVYKKGSEEMEVDRNYYIIGGTKWRRVG